MHLESCKFYPVLCTQACTFNFFLKNQTFSNTAFHFLLGTRGWKLYEMSRLEVINCVGGSGSLQPEFMIPNQ